jgi:hypothetical protein
MERKDKTTKILAILGTVLVWLPVLAPVIFWLIFMVRSGRLDLTHFDFLMPAELFLVALVGGGLLLWAALRAHRRVRWIVTCLGVAIVALVGMQWLAVVTGLAHGETQPGGWEWGLVVGALVIYILGLAGMGIGGIVLLGELGKKAAA